MGGLFGGDGDACVAARFPCPRRQFADALCGMVREPSEDVGEPGLRVRWASSAVVILGSPNTLGPSPKASLVVTMIDVRA